MNNIKKLIFLVLGVGIFSCTESAPTASSPSVKKPEVNIKPAPTTAPEIGTITLPDGTVKASGQNSTPPGRQPSNRPADATRSVNSNVNPMTGKIDAINPEIDEKSAEIAAQLEAMGDVNVGGVKMIKPPPRPGVPQLNDDEKEALYNKTIKKQMGGILKIVSQQYRMGKLAPRLTKTPSGLEYLTIDKGKGAQAINGSFVAFKSMGSTLDGEVFEENFEKDRAYRVKMGTNALIPGLEEAIKTMRAGEKTIFFIPPNLAFGNRGKMGVPPNAMVVYTVILESVN